MWSSISFRSSVGQGKFAFYQLCKATNHVCVLFSSGILWEKKKRKRYKPLKTKYSMMLEEGYQLYLNEMAIDDGKAAEARKIIDKVEVCE